MNVFSSIAEVPTSSAPVRLAIGMFDGVHAGHREVIGGAVSAARQTGGTVVVLTFTPHPSRLFNSASPVLQIFDAREKALRIAALGVDCLVCEPFTKEFSELDAAAFLKMLKTALPSLAGIHVGDNFRFGRRRACDVAALREKTAELGIETVATDSVTGSGDHVSSSRIRALLSAGEMEVATELLVQPYASYGEVKSGRALGRTLDFPTLNLPWEPELLPRFGVYAVNVMRDDGVCANETVAGIANYGLRPTVETNTAEIRPQLEVHLFADAKKIAELGWGTGSKLRVEWQRFIRPEKKFANLAELRAQIAQDVAAARK